MAKPRKKPDPIEEIDDLDNELEELVEDEDEADEEDERTTLSAKEAALRIGTDARTLRKFLRSQRGLVGQGNRWAIDVEDIDSLKKAFAAWHKPKVKEVKVTAPPVDDDEVEEIEDLDFEDGD